MPERRPRIVLAEAFDAPAVEKLRAVGEVVVLDACDEVHLKEAVADCDALLVRTRTTVTRAVIESAPRLRVIGRGGVGLENIDVDAARERDIAVVYTPHASTDAVADLTVGMMIALLRNIYGCDAMVRKGQFWEARGGSCSREMSELTLGIVGMGRIGRAVARRCRNGFGMTVLYNDIVSPGWLDFVATPVTKDQLYTNADAVSLHVPLTEITRNLIAAAALSGFKKGAILINTSRGGVVDSLALAEALAAGTLAGAALDVFDPEPLPADHPLMRTPNTLFTPHIGSRSVAGLARMNDVVEDVVRVLQGRSPLYPAWLDEDDPIPP
jgi:phosphoglycerate dehydrogenase-like enzyme